MLIADPRQDAQVEAFIEESPAAYANVISTQSLFKAIENEKFAESYEKQSVPSREAWMVRKAFENAADQKIIEQFAKAGLYLDATHGRGIAALDNAPAGTAAAIARGEKIALSNGLIREQAAIIFADVAELQSFRITENQTAWDVLKEAGEQAKEHYELCQQHAA
jgi:hypothetical protein